MSPLLALVLSLGAPARAAQSAPPASAWVLVSSTITYHVSHPLHRTEGVSRAARGKGVCSAGSCDFLVAVPVNTFDSGDTNRDLHMLQVTRGARFPMISVRARVPEADQDKPAVSADLEVSFAGETKTYARVPLRLSDEDGLKRVRGTLPLDIRDFKIEPPSLLSVPIKDAAPVDLDLSWRAQAPASR